MKEYTVTWTIDIEAETPLEAAREAQKVARDPGAEYAQVFVVAELDGVGDAEQIDLLEHEKE